MKRNQLFNLFERLFFHQARANDLLLIEFLHAVLGESLSSPITAIHLQGRSNYLLKGTQLNRTIEAETEEGAQLTICLRIHNLDYFNSETPPFMFDVQQASPKVNGKINQFLIHVLNFNLLQESDAYHHCYYTSQLQNSRDVYTQEIHYLELSKFTSKIPNTLLEKWLYFIDQIGRKETSDFYRQLVAKEPVFKLADHLFKRVQMSQNGAIIVKETQLELSEWRDLGHQLEKERIALKMIKAGMPYQQIIKLTDLSLTELDALALTIPLIES